MFLIHKRVAVVRKLNVLRLVVTFHISLTGTKLSLFGSSKNGFGFKQSDLDVCMTINGLETAEV